MSKASEVAFGLSLERGVLERWALRSPYAKGVFRWLKGNKYSDFDFAGFTKQLIPLLYVEIKTRRTPWGQYPDVIFPERKHKFAKRLNLLNLPFIGVTEYSCGTIVEVNLGDEPQDRNLIARWDRPNSPAWHVHYSGRSLRVYQGGG